MKKNLVVLLLSFLGLGCESSKTVVYSVYMDNEHLVDYHVKDNRIEKAIYFDNKRKLKEEVYYQYATNGELTLVNFKGDNSVSGLDKELAMKMYGDEIAQRAVLDKYNIDIPLEFINTSELSDISYFLNSVERIKDTIYNSERLIMTPEINQSYRFYPSYLERFITTTNIVSKYTIFLKNNTVTKEQILFDEGELERTYHWNGSKELQVNILCKYKDGKTASMKNKIVINQN